MAKTEIRLRLKSEAIFLVLSLLIALQPAYAADVSLSKDTLVKVFFSLKGGCTDAIVKEIDQAKTEILVQAYSFTSAPIAKALVYFEGGDNMKEQEIRQLYFLLDKFAGEVSSNNLDVVKGVKNLVAKELSIEESKDIFWCHCKVCLYDWSINKFSSDERIRCPECGFKYIRIARDD